MAITVLWFRLTTSSLGKMLGWHPCGFLQVSQLIWYWIANSKGNQSSSTVLFIDLVHLLVLEYKSNEEVRKFRALSPRMCLTPAVCLMRAVVNTRQSQSHASVTLSLRERGRKRKLWYVRKSACLQFSAFHFCLEDHWQKDFFRAVPLSHQNRVHRAYCVAEPRKGVERVLSIILSFFGLS